MSEHVNVTDQAKDTYELQQRNEYRENKTCPTCTGITYKMQSLQDTYTSSILFPNLFDITKSVSFVHIIHNNSHPNPPYTQQLKRDDVIFKLLKSF